MAKPAVVLVQSSLYRDVPEEWSNKYYFVGPAPTSQSAWGPLVDDILLHLKPCFTSAVSWHRAYGYEDGTQHAVWSYDWTVQGTPPTGTGTAGPGVLMPGDVAATVRWVSSKRNSKGKAIYARKYYHHAYGLSGDPDKVDTTWKAALQTFADQCIQGIIHTGFTLCLPDGSQLYSPEVSQWLTTRTLKRRGKRPPT